MAPIPDPNALHAMLRSVERLGRPPARPVSSPGPRPARPPASYRRHGDPGGRWELFLPAAWLVIPGPPFVARSRTLGSFVEVEEFDGAPRAVPPVLRRDGVDYTLRSVVRRASGKTILLVLGNVADRMRGRLLESAEDRTLAAIRRYFRVTAS